MFIFEENYYQYDRDEYEGWCQTVEDFNDSR